MSNPYINRTIAILGPLWRGNRLDSVTWRSPAEAKQIILVIRQKKAEIRLVKQEITANKRQINANYASQKAGVGKGVSGALARGVFGAKNAGRGNASIKHHMDTQKRHALQPYEEAERFIAQINAGLDQIKTQIDIWLTTNK